MLNSTTDFYESHFINLVSSLGYGVIINNEGNLSPKIERNTSSSKNITISFEHGSFIDKEGRFIVVPQKVSHSFNIDEYSQIFFYIRGKKEKSKSHEQESYRFEKESLDYEIIVSKEEKSFHSEYIELCRILINSEDIKHPMNPFNPKINEIDIRFVPRITNNMAIDPLVLISIHKYLNNYGKFFLILASNIHSVTASIVASSAYHSAIRVKCDKLTTFQIYTMLEQLIQVTSLFNNEIKNKIKDLSDSDFGRNLNRLRSIFYKDESTNFTVKFYDIDLNEAKDRENFWENIFSHINDISNSQDKWELISTKKEQVEIQKKFLLVGRKGGDNLDIEIDNDYVSENHLKITISDINPSLLDIEDLGSSNGTFFKGIRYEQYRKVTVKENEIIELYDYKFDLYHYPIIQEFLNTEKRG